METPIDEVKTTSSHPLPKSPETMEALQIPETMIEALILRRLYTTGATCLKGLSQRLKLPYFAVRATFDRLRKEQFFEVKGMDGQDYTITLSDKGQEFARKSYDICRYNGPAPVSLRDYRNTVMAQTGQVALNRSNLKALLSDLVLTDKLLDQLGPALISKNSIFIYGSTGNGKTSIVRRLTRIYEDVIAVPYAVEFDNQIIVVYDPVYHERVETDMENLDDRWVICRRPCVIVGGELTAHMLELKMDTSTGVYAAPLQMKANNGMFVIDDFGRQILTPEYLLNRWIVPLDRRVDYLSLSYGAKFEIPFETTVVFSTNFEPSHLADEAFLRRIQNKILVEPATVEDFDRIFHRVLENKNLPHEPDSAGFLRKLCAFFTGKELRACYPNDIVSIIESISSYEGIPAEINKDNLKRAATIYFTQGIRDVKKPVHMSQTPHAKKTMPKERPITVV